MSDQELERVKQILVGDLKVALDAVDSKLEEKFNSEQFSDSVSEVLAEALADRTGKDDKVANVLAPTIDRAITESIDQDPKKLAESLYPIMGPAIRKSISETLQQMLENFNELLEDSLSPKSLRWRFDAWRTGRSYSELVMLNTLEYRIEQVFLIHRETSLLIQHQLSDQTDAKDPDMVSSMFSAIQDFIEDSFSTDETNELNTLRLGDLTVVIQRGPAAVLAAVIRGRVPEGFRSEMMELLEGLHSRKRAQLADYSGDPDDFLEIEPDVRKLLKAERKDEEEVVRKFPWPAIISILIGILLYGYWEWLGQQVVADQTERVAKLDAAAGVVVLEVDHSRSNLYVQYLQDPDSPDPAEILGNGEIEGEVKYTIETESVPYLSIEQKVVLNRALRILTPQASTKLDVIDRVIILTGVATVDWLAEARAAWSVVSGAEGFDVSALELVDPALDEIQGLSARVQSLTFVFDSGSADIDPNTEQFLALTNDLRDLVNKISDYDAEIAIDIIGFTDETGTQRINRIVALNRAETLKLHLQDAGIPGELLSAFRSQDYSGSIGKIGGETPTREARLIVRMIP